ncbi:hypothetical protein EDE04_4278 [Streptomyces sp. 2132.2]|uniref:hypothetical protein n=1 Tax=Streptomyces sp. 2132.2 TaxID=2485161 RepID=UPI000FB0C895|nr:hypothetical protein [Streptomyces sp. 2132.2]ROQ97769.1 hypothetical protein EDE04_4278 [Streptomyces sp. 2132.2]
MAEEKAPDGLAGLPSLGSGLADAIMAQANALEVEFESMTNYKKLVDELLKKLDGSGADEKKLAHVTLPDGALGKGFAEADALFKTYTTVHTQLQNLSAGLAGQIEALGIAIMTAGKGYGGVDEDTQARMRSIIAQAKKDYVAERDPLAKQQADTRDGASGQGSKAKGKV